MSKSDDSKKKAGAEGSDAPAKKAGGNRLLLLAAVGLSLVSLGGGFFLARMAYLQDAETYEPDYVEETDGHDKDGYEKDGHDDKAAKDDHGKDKYAQDDHGKKDDGHGKKDDGHGKDSKGKDGHGDGKEGEEIVEGLMEFKEILTNIRSFDARGREVNSFLKMNLVMIYRPDPGAVELMVERKPFMRDLFHSYVRSLNEADLRGISGIIGVKAELLKRARAAAGSDLPQEILISDLIVQ